MPLLWSMHLSYLCLPLAMFGLAITGGDPAASKNVIHLLAIGSIGGMILAMMSRVSLGHTGRPLEVPAYLSVAFALVFAAAIVRAFLPLLDIALTLWAWRLSAVLWLDRVRALPGALCSCAAATEGGRQAGLTDYEHAGEHH